MTLRYALSPNLERAYRATDYYVFFPDGERVLRVGESPRWFMEWLQKRRIRNWSLITACNPHSQLRSRVENRRAQNLLRETLRQAGFCFLRAENRAGRIPEFAQNPVKKNNWQHSWPPEPAFFILDISLGKARQISRHFAQNAFLFGKRGKAATLQKSL